MGAGESQGIRIDAGNRMIETLAIIAYTTSGQVLLGMGACALGVAGWVIWGMRRQ